MPTRTRLLLCLLAALGLMAAGAQADLYKWVDDQGVIHFSDTPPPSDQPVETIATPRYPVNPPSPSPSGFPAEETAPRETIQPVEIYTAQWCRYCKEAIAFLRAHDIPFNQHDIDKDPSAAQRMRAAGGTGGIPFAVINGETIIGFSASRYKRALGMQ